MIGKTYRNEEGHYFLVHDIVSDGNGLSAVVARQRYSRDLVTIPAEEFKAKYTEVGKPLPYRNGDMLVHHCAGPMFSTDFNKILDEMKDIHNRKNADYGDSFGKSCDTFGLTAAAVRLSDKFNRFSSLIKNEGQVKDESLEDTLIDMACYAVMTVEWMRRQK